MLEKLKNFVANNNVEITTISAGVVGVTVICLVTHQSGIDKGAGRFMRKCVESIDEGGNANFTDRKTGKQYAVVEI